jgi:hypothetical protein
MEWPEKFEYISELEVKFETALGYESGDQVGSIYKKAVKNLVRLSLQAKPPPYPAPFIPHAGGGLDSNSA